MIKFSTLMMPLVFLFSIFYVNAKENVSNETDYQSVAAALSVDFHTRTQFDCLFGDPSFIEHSKATCAYFDKPENESQILLSIQTSLRPYLLQKLSTQQANEIATLFQRPYYNPLLRLRSPKFTSFWLVQDLNLDEDELSEYFPDSNGAQEYKVAIAFMQTDSGKAFINLMEDSQLREMITAKISAENTAIK